MTSAGVPTELKDLISWCPNRALTNIKAAQPRRRGGVSDSDTRPGAAAAVIVRTVTVADPTVAGQHKTKDLTHKTKDSSSS